MRIIFLTISFCMCMRSHTGVLLQHLCFGTASPGSISAHVGIKINSSYKSYPSVLIMEELVLCGYTVQFSRVQSGSQLTTEKGNIKNEGLEKVQDPCDP